MSIRSSLALASSALALACSGAEPPYDLRRPLSDDPRVAVVEAQGTARPALAVSGSGAHDLDLGRVGPGSLETALLVPPDRPVGAEIRLVLDGAPLPGTCRVGPERAGAWIPCRIGIPRAAAAASLQVQLTGEAGGRVHVASPVVAHRDARARPPVFLFVLDTLRADRLAATDPRGVGDEIAAFAGDAIVFEAARAPSSWTRTSVASLLTGVAPERHGVHGRFDVLAGDVPTLPEWLQRAGYRTLAWSTNPNVLPVWGFARGFDVFVDVGAEDWRRAKPDGRPVFAALERAVAEAGPGPHAYYVHLMDPHSPYEPPADHLRAVRESPRLRGTHPMLPRPPGREVASLYESYLAEILDLDEQLGAFFDFLRSEGLYDEALVALVSDHGEEFRDHGGLFHGTTLFEEVLRVPLLFKLPRSRHGGARRSEAVELVDLAPTLLAALGLPVPAGLDGRALLPAEDGGSREPAPLFASLTLDGARLASVTHEGFKLVLDRRSAVGLYDLASDPGERRDVKAQHPDRVVALRRALYRRSALFERGWHVRACGAPGPGELHFSVAGAGGTASGRDLEVNDRVPAAGDPLEVRLDLAPHVLPDTSRREPGDAARPDEDELLLPAAQALEIRALGPRSIAVAAGAGGEPVVARTHRIDAQTAAVGALSTATGCTPGKASQPSLRVWLVRAPRTLASDDVDAELVERLRALGYAE